MFNYNKKRKINKKKNLFNKIISINIIFYNDNLVSVSYVEMLYLHVLLLQVNVILYY